jgi:hypothetical protein
MAPFSRRGEEAAERAPSRKPAARKRDQQQQGRILQQLRGIVQRKMEEVMAAMTGAQPGAEKALKDDMAAESLLIDLARLRLRVEGLIASS